MKVYYFLAFVYRKFSLSRNLTTNRKILSSFGKLKSNLKIYPPLNDLQNFVLSIKSDNNFNPVVFALYIKMFQTASFCSLFHCTVQKTKY